MKNYNLSFMNEYIKLKKISIYDLVGIFYVDAYKIMNYFNGLEVPPKSFLSMLYLLITSKTFLKSIKNPPVHNMPGGYKKLLTF